jgi:hypothetical protein
MSNVGVGRFRIVYPVRTSSNSVIRFQNRFGERIQGVVLEMGVLRQGGGRKAGVRWGGDESEEGVEDKVRNWADAAYPLLVGASGAVRPERQGEADAAEPRALIGGGQVRLRDERALLHLRPAGLPGKGLEAAVRELAEYGKMKMLEQRGRGLFFLYTALGPRERFSI